MLNYNEIILNNLKQIIVESNRINQQYEDFYNKLNEVTTTIQLTLSELERSK